MDKYTSVGQLLKGASESVLKEIEEAFVGDGEGWDATPWDNQAWRNQVLVAMIDAQMAVIRTFVITAAAVKE